MQAFVSKLGRDVSVGSVRHVSDHPGGHQHGVSKQIPINLGKTFFRISRKWNIPLTLILARVFVYLPPFISQILDFIYIQRFWFLFWSILNCVTLKTNNVMTKDYFQVPVIKLRSSYRQVPTNRDFTYMRALFNLFRKVMNYSNLWKVDWCRNVIQLHKRK